MVATMYTSNRTVSESLENTINKFKTITTLLTVVLYLRGHNTSLSPTWTVYQRQDTEKPPTQHRLLDHLATVLVRDREVVAVAAGRERNTDISRARTRDALSLSLIISVSHQGDTDIPVEGAEGRLMENRIIVTNLTRPEAASGNTRSGRKEGKEGTQAERKAMSALIEHKTLEFHEHVSSVINIIKGKDSSPLDLGIHVVSRGYRKMRSRLRCTTSLAFLNKVLNAKPDCLPELYDQRSSSLRNKEDCNLSGLLIQAFWGARLFSVEYAGLSSIELKTRAQSNDVLFVKETCVAFHHIFCSTLKAYQTCLDELCKANSETINRMVLHTWLYCTLLETITYSNAFADYLTLAVPNMFDHPFAGAGTRYSTLSRDPRGKSNTLEEEGDTDIDNADLFEAVDSTTLDAYNLWLRRQVVVPHAVDRLVGATPNFQDITHTVISVEHLGTDMWHWEDVVKEILVEDDAVRVETVLMQLRSLMQQDGMDTGGSIRRMCEGLLLPTPMFRGCVHCEGVLASILDERNLDKGLLDLNQVALHQELDDVQGVNLSEMDPCYVGVSEKECPVCNLVNSELGIGADKWPAKPHHEFMLPCALPSMLREDIHEKAEIYFKAKLLDSINALLKDKQQHVRTDSAQTDDYQSDADRKSQEVLRAKQKIDHDNLSVDRALWIT